VTDGVLVVDKPRGPTSHDAVARVRRALGEKHAGHAGTLDPMATGVLVVALGEGTKLAAYLTAQDKAYEATVALGIETDTLDAMGRETRRMAAPAIAERIEEALAHERARTEQVPPAFAAIKTEGVRAYARARRGEVPELAARAVAVRELTLVEHTGDPAPRLVLRLVVSKGYYVRALARDLAQALGTVGHLSALRRTRAGAFTIDESIALDATAEAMRARVLPLATAAACALPIARVTHEGARDARHGRAVRAIDLAPAVEGPHAWLDADGALVAIGERDASGAGRVLRGLVPPAVSGAIGRRSGRH
jgi:tRNA pseudouridine55 synthase